eukprot:CAMPEP_0184492186 /NCGR_PEP_ID=MMETSP0113_2-20130426/22549_1 /TAXON_ID=91329 /ORGANISM="Norrisiella sphaerica, Strain BC52" /LENGTH=430 /DNA_ID=CAMNT_0026876859 /DNA_START=1 /DNA_END=1290 /DNA_ORIENTATION=+
MTPEEAYILEEKERVRRLFTEKKLKITKYSHQHNRDPDWFRHKKHVLICSWAGRPIFSRYGDESKLAAYMGVISAIISNFQRCKDNVRSIVAGRHKFVFLVEGPIYLVAISCTGESELQLRLQLEHVHLQIISILTGSIHNTLRNRPQYDIRGLMGETAETLITELLSDANQNPAYFMKCVSCLRLSSECRDRVGAILKSHRTKNLLFAVLLAGSKVVSLVRIKDKILYPSDLLLLTNFVNNSQSLRSGEGWTPICLPEVSRKGYVWAYVCFLQGDLSLTLITADNQDFFQLQEVKRRIVEKLSKSDDLSNIQQAINRKPWTVSNVRTEIYELVHFLYKFDGARQFVMPASVHPFKGRQGLKFLMREYKKVTDRVAFVKSDKAHTVYFHASDVSAVLGWIRPGEFEIYCTFTPLVPKEVAITACNRILRW